MHLASLDPIRFATHFSRSPFGVRHELASHPSPVGEARLIDRAKDFGYSIYKQAQRRLGRS